MHSADVNAPGRDGETPLHLASRQGRLEISEALLQHGADVNHQDKDGWTSLHLTSQSGHARLSQTFLSYGADANPRAGTTMV